MFLKGTGFLLCAVSKNDPVKNNSSTQSNFMALSLQGGSIPSTEKLVPKFTEEKRGQQQLLGSSGLQKRRCRFPPAV